MKRSIGTKGGNMLQRAVRSAARDTFSNSQFNINNNSTFYKPLSISSRPFFLSSNTINDIDSEFDNWVSIENNNNNDFNEDEDNDDENDGVFGPVPSKVEVLNAVSSLQLVADPSHYSQLLEDNGAYNLESIEEHENRSPTPLASRGSSFGSESDWIEPSMYLCYPMMLERSGSIRVYDALHLLQSEPSVKKMVISLSSDKAVWDAVLNNQMVRELRDSLSEVGSKVPDDQEDSNGRPTMTNIFRWLYENTKVKVIEMIERITELMNELFQLSEGEKTEESTTGRTEEMLQISLLLSIMVLIIVVVNRAHQDWP